MRVTEKVKTTHASCPPDNILVPSPAMTFTRMHFTTTESPSFQQYHVIPLRSLEAGRSMGTMPLRIGWLAPLESHAETETAAIICAVIFIYIVQFQTQKNSFRSWKTDNLRLVLLFHVMFFFPT